MSRRDAVKEGIVEALDAWGAHGTPEPNEAPEREKRRSAKRVVDESTRRPASTQSVAKPKSKSRQNLPSAPAPADPPGELREKPAGYVERAGEPRRRITAYLSPEMARRLRVYAAGEAAEMSVVISAALEEYLARRKA